MLATDRTKSLLGSSTATKTPGTRISSAAERAGRGLPEELYTPETLGAADWKLRVPNVFVGVELPRSDFVRSVAIDMIQWSVLGAVTVR